MTKKESMKKFFITKQPSPKNCEKSVTKFTDKRNFDHPYCKDKTKWGKLKFFLQLTRFEDGEYGFGCYGYESKLMDLYNIREAHNILAADWDKPGRKAWNSLVAIGIDEAGAYFYAPMYNI